jgi:hypothetical protein
MRLVSLNENRKKKRKNSRLKTTAPIFLKLSAGFFFISLKIFWSFYFSARIEKIAKELSDLALPSRLDSLCLYLSGAL